MGGVTLPLALADLGLIDEYEFVVQPIVAGLLLPGCPTSSAGAGRPVEARGLRLGMGGEEVPDQVGGHDLGGGDVAPGPPGLAAGPGVAAAVHRVELDPVAR